ncbi:MAG TPA: hypothetical protein VF552_15005 [Allosphingosinicella sp.]|jgi:hypothetical protein
MEIKNLPALDLEAGLPVGSNSDAVTSVGGVIIGIVTGIIAGLAADSAVEG